MPKKSHFTVFALRTLCTRHEKTRESHLYYWDHACKVNEWCFVDSFHHEFSVSTQIMVRDYCLAKCKRFSTCDGLLMALQAIFFAIQNRYVSSNSVSISLQRCALFHSWRESRDWKPCPFRVSGFPWYCSKWIHTPYCSIHVTAWTVRV